MGSAISFLNLVVKGALEVKSARLVISDYGYRLLNVRPAQQHRAAPHE
jgi:hypothetical protein